MLVAIPFGNGYFVNENGEVFSYKNDGLKKLKPITNGHKGYAKVRLYAGCRDMTNAQKIRAMTDDELADFMNRDISGCPPTGDCNKASDDCKACWLGWLQQPAEEGDNDKAD